MFRATIYTDIGETYRLILPDGRRGGAALLALFTMLAAFVHLQNEGPTSDDDDEIFSWFSQLESEGGVSLAEVAAELVQTVFAESPTYETMKEKWVDVKGLLEHVRVIRRLLVETDLEEPVWLEVAATVVELDTLIETLELAIQRQANRVAIHMH